MRRRCTSRSYSATTDDRFDLSEQCQLSWSVPCVSRGILVPARGATSEHTNEYVNEERRREGLKGSRPLPLIVKVDESKG